MFINRWINTFINEQNKSSYLDYYFCDQTPNKKNSHTKLLICEMFVC